jgi:YebC/PmpR family DNA-binding regulatory protein
MGRAHEVRAKAMAATAAQKSKLYAKFAKEVYIAAKQGVPDPNSNLSLRKAVEKAKMNQVPADVIKRAIDKASGSDTTSYSENFYEGFGPGASTLIIECLTDNPNRTIANVRTCFNKSKSKIGSSGSVSFDYQRLSVIALTGATEEEILESLIEKDVSFNDIETDDDLVTVYGEFEDLYDIKTALEDTFKDKISIIRYETAWISNSRVTLDGEEKMLFERLVTLLEDDDDVQNVYHNVELV